MELGEIMSWDQVFSWLILSKRSENHSNKGFLLG